MQIPLVAQTNWSQVSVRYTNQCNVYSLEILGVSDTCFSQIETEFVDQYADPVYRTFSKKFNIYFSDTGTYYGTILIKNECGRDDSTIYLTLKVQCKPLKCNWFSAKLKQYNQNRLPLRHQPLQKRMAQDQKTTHHMVNRITDVILKWVIRYRMQPIS
mgnify:CR=1 FL=1